MRHQCNNDMKFKSTLVSRYDVSVCLWTLIGVRLRLILVPALSPHIFLVQFLLDLKPHPTHPTHLRSPLLLLSKWQK